MSGKTCRDGLHELVSKVAPSLTLIVGEPDSIQNTPAFYTILDDFDVEESDQGELLTVRWHFLHRLVVTNQVNAVAEDLLLGITQAILEAVVADPKLGGRLHHTGRARITAGDAGFTEIPTGGPKYRTVDFASEVLEVTERA